MPNINELESIRDLQNVNRAVSRRDSREALVAQTEHLPIYKRAYDLCLYLEQVVRSFSRYEKYALGSDLREVSRKVLLRLAQDAKAFAKFSSFEHAIGLAVDIARQTEGWLSSQRGGSGPSGPPSQSREAATANPPTREPDREGVSAAREQRRAQAASPVPPRGDSEER